MITGKKLSIRLPAVLIFFLVPGVSSSSKAALTARASAQAGVEKDRRFSLPSAVIQEPSILAHAPSFCSGGKGGGLL